MKVAFWTLGIIVVAIFGLYLVNLFGNITVTNQLNYTSMKNTVEASMHDAIDSALYQNGFCFCTNTKGKKQFDDKSEYYIEELTGDTCNTDCEARYGEYVINSSAFVDSLVRRFSELVNNNKDYTLIIQDIIEYPPKVSVRVDSKDGFDISEGEFTITNQVDAILEEKE